MDHIWFKIKTELNKNSTAGVVFALPFVIGFLMFMVVPMGMSLYYSFCEFEILGAPKFIGLGNYLKMFTEDETFYKSISVTFFYALVSVPLRLIFALMVAMILQRTTKATGFYRAAYYLPSIIGGSVAISILWKRLFAEDGTFNCILQIIGVNSHFSWLGNKHTAIWVLIILAIWQFGSSMLIFLSALKQIPFSLYEASRVDGAGKTNQFFRITLPLLTPTIFFNLVMQMISGFLAFTQCFIITQGRPMSSTLFYSVYMYQQSFEFYNTGYGAAMAWVMLLLISVITLFLFWSKKFWVYEGGN
ncbi:carbohydrate ABC transporter permease [Hungatella hathewayi]|uniref:carbohydrate ABC transporter permease n=1 Tax=Hungatella hathewayi TaxID=154046 RepID=UPI000E5522DF|nr:sugar ABC transporter permease [Hungatella hathewayi]RHB77108.1 sugar ABC transporter permease [Hungatella hathewayi]